MEPSGSLAPPVVAVMVVHQPGPWFEEVLDALAKQDYGNLRNLFLVVGDPGDTPERIRERVPNAFVRRAEQSRFRICSQRGAAPGGRRQRVLLLPARRCGARPGSDSAAGGGAVPLECGHRRPQAGHVGRPIGAAARGARRRPLRRDRPHRRAGRGRSGAARLGLRHVCRAVGVLAGARRPVPHDRWFRPGDRVLRRRRRSVLARPPRRRG